jgi:hypothetical protein
VFFLVLWSFNAGIVEFLVVPWWTLGNHLSKGCPIPAMIRPLLPLLALTFQLFSISWLNLSHCIFGILPTHLECPWVMA